MSDRICEVGEITVPDYLKGKVKYRGTPKTACLAGVWNGETYNAPLECWISAMLAIMTPEQKGQFFPMLKKATEQWDLQSSQMADIRATIPMPIFKG